MSQLYAERLYDPLLWELSFPNLQHQPLTQYLLQCTPFILSQIVYQMVQVYGMNDKIGQVAFPKEEGAWPADKLVQQALK